MPSRGHSYRIFCRQLPSAGPAPPARGRQDRRAHCDHAVRTSPTYVGDDIPIVLAYFIYAGPVPPARGRRTGRDERRPRRRSNPACAGTTSPCRTAPASRSDQPRLRGDDAERLGSTFVEAGPNPRLGGGDLATNPHAWRHLGPAPPGGDDTQLQWAAGREGGSAPPARRRRIARGRRPDHQLTSSACAGTNPSRSPSMRAMSGPAPHTRRRRQVDQGPRQPRRTSPACAGTIGGAPTFLAHVFSHQLLWSWRHRVAGHRSRSMSSCGGEP